MSCYDVLKGPLASAFALEVPALAFVAAQALAVATDRLLTCPKSEFVAEPVTPDEAVAIAAYTFDLRPSFMSEDVTGEGRDNFYMVLNATLRKRNTISPQVLMVLRPYLTYLLRGLKKVKPISGIMAFRGVPAASLDAVFQEYSVGRMVHWSGFTSSTINLLTARTFAGGPGGVVFVITVVDGRTVKELSAFRSEDEILLSPNSKFIVASAATEDKDGYFVVQLIQMKEGDYVF